MGRHSAGPPDDGPLTTGPLTTGPLTTGPLTTGPLTTGPLTTGTPTDDDGAHRTSGASLTHHVGHAPPAGAANARAPFPLLETVVFGPVAGVAAALLMRWAGSTWNTCWSAGAAVAVAVVAAVWFTRATPGQSLGTAAASTRTPPEGPAPNDAQQGRTSGPGQTH